MNSRKRTGTIAIAAALLTLLALVLITVSRSVSKPDTTLRPFATLTVSPTPEEAFPDRLAYQTRLNASPHRDEPGFDVIVIDGRTYVRTDMSLTSCDLRIACGTVEKVGNAYHVSLPVGYTHESNVTPDPTSWKPVSVLTYWDPSTHELTATTTTKGSAVEFPEVLKGHRKTADLKPGETAWTAPGFIRETPDGKTYMIDLLLMRELLGPEYGYSVGASVTRMKDGSLEVTMPPCVAPVKDRSANGLIPVNVR